MTSGSCKYSSKEEHSGSVRSGMHIAGCFYLRTSIAGHPVLVSTSPGNNTPLCPCHRIPLATASIFPLTTFEFKVIVSVSSLSWVVLVGRGWLSSKVSAQRSSYCPIYHRLRDPAPNCVDLACPRCFLQYQPHEYHGALRIPVSLCFPT